MFESKNDRNRIQKYIEMIHSIVVPATLTADEKEKRYQPRKNHIDFALVKNALSQNWTRVL